MQKIKILTNDVAEKIAAGEVVERPYCAVKELIENSLDAGATRITIEIKDCGVELIKITDNGFGMNQEDLKICLLRHATSKIENIEDLEKIQTMGFRGEALAAISRISKTEIKTKEQNSEIGYVLNNEIISPIGMNNGTQITITDLFYNTPARKKFLKSKQSEYAYIISTVENIALANHEVAFKLIIDDKEKLNLNSVANKVDRIRDIFGTELAENLIPLDVDNGTLKITGFVSSPEFIAKKRNNYFTFMNKRFIVSKLIIGAINNAYSEHIVKGRFPVAFLFFELSGEYFDINVHPRKIDIKFTNEQGIFSMVQQAIVLALRNRHTEKPQTKPMFFSNFEPRLQERKTLSNYNKEFFESTQKFDLKKTEKLIPQTIKQNENLVEKTDDISVIGWLPTKFILAYNNNRDFLMIDQHAAHERVNYEQLKKDFFNNKIEVQGLLLSKIIELPASLFEIAEINLKKFEKFGFFVEKFGANSLKITAVPAIIEKGCEKTSFLKCWKF